MTENSPTLLMRGELVFSARSARMFHPTLTRATKARGWWGTKSDQKAPFSWDSTLSQHHHSNMAAFSTRRALLIIVLIVAAVQLVLAESAPTYTPPKPDPSLPLSKLPDARPPIQNRTFTSRLVEAELERVASRIGDKALRRLWLNCYPNSLDTTVAWHDADAKQKDLAKAFPRSFFVTGDITAS